MSSEQTPANEAARLHALERYRLLDTPREQDFDDIAELAAEICGTPIAVVNLIGEGRQFFKAEVGLGVRETPLETSFCRQAILQSDFLYVPDATRDPRFQGNPLVTGEPGLRFYAGALLKTPDGHPVGTVCVLDTAPRDLTERQRHALMRLARQTMAQMELRRAERAQREERRAYAQILDSATDYAIVATDRAGRVTSWNAGARQILGWREDDIRGRSIEGLYVPEDRTAGRLQAEMDRALETGSATDERWHLRGDGTRFWSSGQMTPLRAEDGTIAGFVKVLRDQTEARSAEAILEASELRFRSLVEISPQVVWFADARGQITYCNRYWYTYTGLPPGETSESSWMDVCHPDHRARVHEAWTRAVAEGSPYEVEVPFRRASDGRHRWFLSRGEPVRDAAGTIRSWIGISLDIHERKAAQERFATLTKLAPSIIWSAEPDGRLSYLNDRWVEYTGQPAEEALPDGWTSRIHPEDVDALLQTWSEVRASGAHYETEARLRRHDGAYRWFLIRAEPLRGEDGAVRGWLGSNSDIDDRSRVEETLRRTQEQLHLAVRATEIGIFDFDVISGDLGWDDRVRSLFGLPPGAPVSYETYLAGLHPSDREEADRAVQAALDPAGSGTFDIAYRTIGLTDGIERWVAARGQAIVVNGRTQRFVGTVRDITEAKRAEEGLRETEERYRLAARATNDAIWDWNFATNHVLWNEALEAAYGHALGTVEPTGDWWIGHIHPDDRARIDASIHAVIDGTGTAWTDEYRFLRADGQYASVLDRGYVIRNEAGAATRMIGAMLDITGRKRAEERQRLLTGELQHRVKNTLALVQAIASQTFRGTTAPDEARGLRGPPDLAGPGA